MKHFKGLTTAIYNNNKIFDLNQFQTPVEEFKTNQTTVELSVGNSPTWLSYEYFANKSSGSRMLDSRNRSLKT